MKSKVRNKMMLALECGANAEDNLTETDQLIYKMYPLIRHEEPFSELTNQEYFVPEDVMDPPLASKEETLDTPRILIADSPEDVENFEHSIIVADMPSDDLRDQNDVQFDEQIVSGERGNTARGLEASGKLFEPHFETGFQRTQINRRIQVRGRGHARGQARVRGGRGRGTQRPQYQVN